MFHSQASFLQCPTTKREILSGSFYVLISDPHDQRCKRNEKKLYLVVPIDSISFANHVKCENLSWESPIEVSIHSAGVTYDMRMEGPREGC